MFGKCLFLAFYMAWIYSIFHGVLLQCVLIMLAVEYFMETSLSLVYGNIWKLEHDISLCLPTCFICCGYYIAFHGNGLVYVIMTKGQHLIPINFITCHLKTVSKNFSIFRYEESWWYLVRFTMNIIFKMSDFGALLLLLQLKDNGVSNAFWN